MRDEWATSSHHRAASSDTRLETLLTPNLEGQLFRTLAVIAVNFPAKLLKLLASSKRLSPYYRHGGKGGRTGRKARSRPWQWRPRTAGIAATFWRQRNASIAGASLKSGGIVIVRVTDVAPLAWQLRLPARRWSFYRDFDRVGRYSDG